MRIIQDAYDIINIEDFNRPCTFTNKWYGYQDKFGNYCIQNADSDFVHIEITINRDDRTLEVVQRVKHVPDAIIRKTVDLMHSVEDITDYSINVYEMWKGGEHR